MIDQNLSSLNNTSLLTQLAQMQRELKDMKDFVFGQQVSSARIKNLRWDKGQGGILRLGGLDNVNGELSILDEDGNEKGLWDKDGILIRDGTIVIENASGVDAFDSQGIISMSNFANSFITDANLNVTTSSSFIDLPGSSLPTITLTRETIFLISYDVFARNPSFSTTGAIIEVSLFDGVTGLFSLFASGIYNSIATQYAFAGRTRGLTLAAGSHDLKLMYRAVGGEARVAGFDFSCVQFGN